MSAHAPDLAFQLVTLSKKIDQLLIKIEHGDEGYKDRSDNSDNNDIFHSIIFDKKLLNINILQKTALHCLILD